MFSGTQNKIDYLEDELKNQKTKDKEDEMLSSFVTTKENNDKVILNMT